MTALKTLQNKITKKDHLVGVIGLGYVGLPLISAICKKEISAYGFDVDPHKIHTLNAGKSYIDGVTDAHIQAHISHNLLKVSNDFSELKDVDVIIICVPTPLDQDEKPDLSYIAQTTEAIANHLQDGQLIILESTTYPGTVSDIMRPILQPTADAKNINYYLAYSPEREDPGNPNFETSSTPKIVGAESPDVLEVTVEFYKQFITHVVPVSSIEVAEAAKITENVFRAVNIALVNELKLIYDRMGIDVWEVIDAAATKPFGYMPFYPGPGIGGHCIPIDPIYLSWKAANVGQKTQFIELAASINQSMTSYIFDKLIKGLGVSSAVNLKGKSIMLIGIAYKKNVADQRESPAFPLMQKLFDSGANISFHDQYIDEITPNRNYPQFAGLKSQSLSAKSVQNKDAIIIVTNHDDIDYKSLQHNASLIIDTRNVYADKLANVVKA